MLELFLKLHLHVIRHLLFLLFLKKVVLSGLTVVTSTLPRLSWISGMCTSGYHNGDTG